jgi:hypothetical protein
MATLFVDHVDKLRQQGYVNKLKVFDVSQMGGLEGQFYDEGAYDLREDEALIVEATVPAKCVYRSLILTNELYETPVPSVRKVALNEVRTLLPRDTPVVTPAQRETAVRERRSALQQRPPW